MALDPYRDKEALREYVDMRNEKHPLLGGVGLMYEAIITNVELAVVFGEWKAYVDTSSLGFFKTPEETIKAVEAHLEDVKHANAFECPDCRDLSAPEGSCIEYVGNFIRAVRELELAFHWDDGEDGDFNHSVTIELLKNKRVMVTVQEWTPDCCCPGGGR